jgi:wyosine [tRNA(Phe)-imidazoG37] synthetase (radical SAM superfamily)
MRGHFPYLKTRVISNGSLLYQRNVQAIGGYLYRLNISLNAARKDTYERTMKLKWDKTMKGILRLQEYKAKLGFILPHVSASYVVHRDNLEELPEFPGLLRSLNIDRVFLHIMDPPAERWRMRYPYLMGIEDSVLAEPPLWK